MQDEYLQAKNVPHLLIDDYLIASKLTCSSACDIDLNLYCRIPTTAKKWSTFSVNGKIWNGHSLGFWIAETLIAHTDYFF